MSHGPAEGIGLGGRVIDMQWVIISRETGEEDDVRFRYGSSRALPFVTNGEIIKRPDRPGMLGHGQRFPPYDRFGTMFQIPTPGAGEHAFWSAF